ncbi:hypothetical protein [Nesterenkonia rhizosphaerae]|uniref:ATP-binding protein n=1 Tax=Nesterenkonia rhizosphaerae TaxID=1348272 RepID=A0ABP9G6R8_9MICC
MFQLFSFERSTDAASDPAAYSTRVSSAAAAAAPKGGVFSRDKHACLFAVRGEGSYTPVLGLDTSVNEKSAQLMGQAFGTRSRRLDELPAEVRQSRGFAQLVLNSQALVGSTQAGADPAEVARVLSTSMPPGCWVGVSFRAPTSNETKWHMRWLQHRHDAAAPTHNSIRQGVVAASFYAGGPTTQDACEALGLLASSMPGFDLDVRARPVPKVARGTVRSFLLAGVLAALWMLGVPFPDALYDSLKEAAEIDVQDQVALVWSYLWVPVVGFAAGGLRGVLASPVARLKRSLRTTGALPAPAQRKGKPAAPQRERWEQRGFDRETGSPRQPRHIKERPGGYPLADDVFKFGASTFTSMANPHGSSLVSSAGVAERAATPELLEADGLIIGEAAGEPVPIPSRAMRFGTMVFGRPGSGKTSLLQGLWGFLCQERVQPSGHPDRPGEQSALIAFETKGKGAAGYLGWAEYYGDRCALITARDPDSIAIDPFYINAPLRERALHAVDCFVYAYDEGAVGDRSREALRAVYTAAFCFMDHQIIDQVWAGSPEGKRLFTHPDVSVHDYAHALLAGLGEEPFQDLMATLGAYTKYSSRELSAAEHEDALAAQDAMGVIASKSAAARATYCEAPRNKVDDLRSMGFYFTSARRQASWHQVLNGKRSVVVNTGSVEGFRRMAESQTQLLTRMLVFSLHAAIMEVCTNWEDTGESVSIFADELAMLQGSSPDILVSWRAQGRTYGVRTFFATQEPELLLAKLLKSVMTYATVGSFIQPAIDQAEVVSKQLNSEVSPQDLAALNKYELALRTQVEDRPQPTVVVAVKDFDAIAGLR